MKIESKCFESIILFIVLKSQREINVCGTATVYPLPHVWLLSFNRPAEFPKGVEQKKSKMELFQKLNS
jgi:hypothetical protein